ncbi:Holliday junction DNA helicase RuvA [bacterium CG2_30_37_16]|nr:MAG: Holliday junction DNA helicase RuvA [bacterium CG2_30_37_16]PIP30360.1 MAG: Holliday junction branch migration protein RuvA [bacterium (Candidatus Howlettbacteria) CG23_combo_of_CG06-09_8_20_14_all_37_9]PIX99994.1 MAG: Holliday junction branch migration protein RuvA [bacterium (Candidatus Howlettbacteria) CG_4_10_14_3_um_filter_37_10]PJB05759.1 MAG: Holliday junction branch migration protein RuvA [bacterium (Candidatus Howlettbacteria) CG_4_9_14_3_um_filter_37_10]
MINFLSGEVILKKDSYLTVLVSGVGFKVNIAAGVFGRATVGKKINLYTYLQVREDNLSLFGFDSEEELFLFEKIISVSGIGPKAGLSILSALGAKELKKSIDESRPEIIVSVPGVGKKTAERLVLELSGKLERIEGRKTDDAYSALTGLGYSAREADAALKNVSGDLSAEERVKQALKAIRQ